MPRLPLHALIWSRDQGCYALYIQDRLVRQVEPGEEAAWQACLIRDVTSEETAAKAPRALVSTRRFADGFAALQAYRPRWHIEDDTYRELKEGSWLEQQRWGRDVAAAVGRTTLTCLAFNTAQVYRLQAGERLALVAIRRLRHLRQRDLGNAPAVIYLAGCYGVFSLEELLEVLGSAPRESLLPAVTKSAAPDSPTSFLISKCLALQDLAYSAIKGKRREMAWEGSGHILYA